MEALLEEKEGDVDSWNDERLDELNGRVKDGFASVDERFTEVDKHFVRLEGEMKEGFEKADLNMKALFAQMDKRMDRFEDRIERLANTFMVVGGGFAAAVVAATIFG